VEVPAAGKSADGLGADGQLLHILFAARRAHDLHASEIPYIWKTLPDLTHELFSD
jgi:hypothetical protein